MKISIYLRICFLLIIISSCHSNNKTSILGFWELKEIKVFEDNFFKSSVTAIEKNSKYRFEKENNQLKIALIANEKIHKVLSCKYEIINDTLKIFKNLEKAKPNAEVYIIQELNQDKLILLELSTKDVRIFKREIQ